MTLISTEPYQFSSNFRARFEETWRHVAKTFPFPNYVREPRKEAIFDMVNTVARHAGERARVLDFGAGPCDKTALFAGVGMDVTACDDMQDVWHNLADNRDLVLSFARSMGIKYQVTETSPPALTGAPYDAVMAHDVIEHLHSSPRILLNHLIDQLKPSGYLIITVPNAGNVRKRLALLFGGTNYSNFRYYYWYPGVWRGHIREYVESDIRQLCAFLQVQPVELRSFSIHLDRLPALARPLFTAVSAVYPSLRDSWLLVAQRPVGWKSRRLPEPEQFSSAFGKQYYSYSNDQDAISELYAQDE